MLTPGTHLGPYEIVALLGSGGMGEVYRGRDRRLDRDVAIKVLRADVVANPAVRQRFEREARAISGLSHPHVCTLYDIGQQDGLDFLVMEFLEGETLEKRLTKGALPPEQVLKYGIEIADALEKAHRQGIVHRDLKPGNIMLSKAGAKLMDFGLAKLTEQPAPVTVALTEMATTDGKLTDEGVILGTFQYMAPEQLEAREADARTDIFALGAVLYEMATGRPAFTGRTKASLIAAILSSEPPPIPSLQPMVPPALDRVVRTCLAKDPDDRWQTAHDLLLELKWVAEAGLQAGAPAPVVSRNIKRERLAWTAALVVLLAILIPSYVRRAPPERHPIWTSILPPERTAFSYFAGPVTLSPDGRKLAFVATTEEGKELLWVRPLDAPNAQALPGTEGASYPFWSPDSRFLGFFANGKLKTIEASGGPVLTICDAPGSRGGTWGQEGVILFATTWDVIQRVSSSGGIPTPVTKFDPARNETSHRWPYFLPDGRHFFYLAANFAGGTAETALIYVASLDSKENKLLLHARSNVGFTPGYLLFVRNRTLMAQPFDEKPLKLMGEAFPVVEHVQYDERVWRGSFSASTNGVLAYHGGGLAGNSQLLWFDRNGKQLGPAISSGDFLGHAISPDGKRVAVAVLDSSTANYEIWAYPLVQGTSTRLTFGPHRNTFPTWSPDGSRVVFASNANGKYNLYAKPSNGTGQEELLLESKSNKYPTAWSADGRFIAYTTNSPGKAKSELWLLPQFGDRKPVPFLQADFNVAEGEFSPDGRWMAYSSDESGRVEVYVTSFPARGGKWQVSTAGGSMSRWRKDGKAIFYLSPNGDLMVSEVNGQGQTFEVKAARPLFHLRLQTGAALYDLSASAGQIGYEAFPDGSRFLVNSPAEGGVRPITLVVNWTADLHH